VIAGSGVDRGRDAVREDAVALVDADRVVAGQGKDGDLRDVLPFVT